MNFIGNVEGFAIGTGAADVIVADGFTGNVALKVMEGSSSALLGAIRGAAMSSRRSKLGGLLLRPALRGLRDEISPEEQGGAVLLGLRKLAVVPHGSFGARGFQRAIEVAARGVREDVAGRTHARLAGRGRCSGRRPKRRLACPTIHDARGGPRADPRSTWPTSWSSTRRAIQESTHFSEDLSADSLDLYTLVQELEDSYGVKMSDEQAAQILTVGQAVDFVLAHDPSGP